ncbi:MAG TPA: hypothetical protein VK843_18485 [Planctomycetota bacterium]|nr:hypothetical protein [Planctomycetota bacterium]
MNQRDPVPRELSSEDVAAAMSWIDGELEPEAAMAFELRMSQDSELAQRVEALVGIDALLRRQAKSASTGAGSRHWGVWMSLAAAAGLLICALAWSMLRKPATLMEVALAPSFAMAEDWTQGKPALEGASAPGIGVSRGPNQKQLSARDFLSASNAAEEFIATAALEEKRRELDAGWFVVPIDLREPAVVLVLSFSDAAGASRIFPSDPVVVRGHLAKGRSLLPSPRAVEGSAPDTLEYRPGFLVPIGAKELTVLVAAHRDPEDRPELHLPIEELDGLLAKKPSVERVEEFLKAYGFQSQRLVVREPK